MRGGINIWKVTLIKRKLLIYLCSFGLFLVMAFLINSQHKEIKLLEWYISHNITNSIIGLHLPIAKNDDLINIVERGSITIEEILYFNEIYDRAISSQTDLFRFYPVYSETKRKTPEINHQFSSDFYGGASNIFYQLRQEISENDTKTIELTKQRIMQLNSLIEINHYFALNSPYFRDYRDDQTGYFEEEKWLKILDVFDTYNISKDIRHLNESLK